MTIMGANDCQIACARLEAANKWFRDEIARLCLTDEERECLEWAEEIAGNCEEFGRVSTLRGLLERMTL